jgi:AbiV family abortive infection protein
MIERLHKSASACLQNGRRLLNEAEFLEFEEPPTTAHFIIAIAHEEFAKALLLALVVRGVIPWDKRLLRAARDHVFKQLLCVVMDYVSPDTDEFLERCKTVTSPNETPSLPKRVADAIRLLRFEKLGRWVDQAWVWAEDPEYDPEALAVAKGRLDRQKHDALYVRLARDGGVASIPHDASLESVGFERERGERMADFSEAVLNGDKNPGLDYHKVEHLIQALFESLPGDKPNS